MLDDWLDSENPFGDPAELGDKVIDYDINQAREDYIKDRLACGYRVCYPADNELQLDIDSEEQYAAWKKAEGIISRNEVFTAAVEEAPSSSGLPHCHVRIRLPFDVTPWQRIALQAALGSDPVRELLSCVRMLKGDVHPTLLVERPE